MIVTPTVLLLMATPGQLAGGWWSESFLHHGAGSGANFGNGVLALEDRDRDGVPEVVIAQAPWPSTDTLALGIFSGSDGALLARFDRPAQNDSFGSALVLGSDLDGDGVAELYAGARFAPAAQGSEQGAVYVLSGCTLQQLQRWAPTGGSRFFGAAMCNLGDQDGDGLDDFAVGAPYTSTSQSHLGRVELLSGADGSLISRLDSQTHHLLGAALAVIPDLDGDGRRDFLVGAPNSFNNLGAVLAVSSATLAFLFEVRGYSTTDYLGEVIASAGDLTGDGKDEFLAIARAYGSTPSRLLLYDGAGGSLLRSFEAPVGAKFHSTGLVSGVDFDGDGGVDAVAALIGTEARLIVVRLDGSGLRLGGVVTGGSADFGGKLAISLQQGGTAAVIAADRMAAIVRRLELAPALDLDRNHLRAASGGRVRMLLDFALTEANRPYLLLASAAPAGQSLFAGIEIPLLQDQLFAHMVYGPPAFLHGARGRLDGAGDASATLALPPRRRARLDRAHDPVRGGHAGRRRRAREFGRGTLDHSALTWCASSHSLSDSFPNIYPAACGPSWTTGFRIRINEGP